MTAVQTLEKPYVMTDLQSVLSLDGKDDYVRIPFNEPETEVTHEFWFKTNDANCGLFSVVLGTVGAGGHDRHLYLSNGNIKNRLWSDEIIYSSNLNLADNNWHHVAHVFGASVGGQKIYIDGCLVASGLKSSSDFDTQDALLIGYSQDAQHKYFKGQITEVRVWNKIRTEAELQQDMNHHLTGKEDNLIGYWRLNGDASDQTSNNNNGTINGATSIKETLDFIKTKNVEIADVFYDGDFAIHKANQYVEIRNPNGVSVDISGWKIKSLAKDKEFTFPMDTSLEANQTIRVYTNEYHAESGGFTFNSNWGIWKKSGDTATLLNAEGNKVSSFSYDNN